MIWNILISCNGFLLVMLFILNFIAKKTLDKIKKLELDWIKLHASINTSKPMEISTNPIEFCDECIEKIKVVVDATILSIH